MSLILKQPITGPAAWRGCDLAGDRSWVHRLSDAAVACIDAALARVRARGLRFPGFTKDDFPLGALRADLDRIADELENGRGFLLLHGLPVGRYTDEDIAIVDYGLGLHLGEPVRQDPKGDLLGEVMAVGEATLRTTRVYATDLHLSFHCDPSDVVGLLCVRRARAGGLSSLVSVAAIYNALLACHPELLGLYDRPMYFAHLCEPLPSRSPIFSHQDGQLSCRYLRQYLELGHEIRLDMMLEPGDLQFANNGAVLQARTAFEDEPDPALRRRMLRLWLKMPNARTLAPEFPGRNGFPAPLATA